MSASAPAHLHKCTDATIVPGKTTINFSITDKVGALDECLAVIKSLNISLTRIESRPSKTSEFDYEFFVDFEAANPEQVVQVSKSLEAISKQVHVVGTGGVAGPNSSDIPDSTPWFPRKMVDLDTFADKVLEMGEELSADHPGAKDAVYRARRSEITNIAKTYKTGQPIPHVEYTAVEKETWATVFNKLITMFPSYACREHQYVFPLLIQNCAYGPDNIPQLDGVSKFLKDCTGFTLRPVMGLLTSRDFLNGLAFRVFHSTQYIRHHSRPLYTPEPDVCHELLGHVPLFANPDFADFSQEIGLASLGASDDDIERLATIYWFTVEFGICRQGDQLRAYGAGLLSSFGELEYCLSDKPEVRPFEPSKVAQQKYPITEYQPVYFVAESFKDAQMRVREFANSLSRPFSVRYNAYTESIEILDSKEKVLRYAQSIKTDMLTLVDALGKLA
ncbi:MAG: Biopterin-dependent aromatic amino acid hydroxylase-domain-containing protein [Linnemannia gamsii]|nr:MAG: Biopterin-dependent aromatic amino acid hydroxylase-domain-containing protein [Linnemannia gamsii]